MRGSVNANIESLCMHLVADGLHDALAPLPEVELAVLGIAILPQSATVEVATSLHVLAPVTGLRIPLTSPSFAPPGAPAPAAVFKGDLVRIESRVEGVNALAQLVNVSETNRKPQLYVFVHARDHDGAVRVQSTRFAANEQCLATVESAAFVRWALGAT